MSNQATKTNNSHLLDKVMLRKNNLPRKKNLRVLDLFHGEGCMWANVRQQRRDVILTVDGIDILADYTSFSLTSDNKKILPSLNFDNYDVIDVDAYGSPIEQLSEILPNIKGPTTIFYTFIQTAMGAVTHSMLEDLGYTKDMIKKIPTLFFKNAHDKFIDWLGLHGVQSVTYINPETRKYYGVFIAGK